ncbi:MAG TPA: hypothetical protein HA282_03230 [Nanoarchaeota archaeon]|nr:MAG: hypothetical protein QT01_C0007G0027 [archaeon GW2011_AR6]HIH18094.1 hypothetical protein [Nanoarchaeota archaeon]HIH34015.1 hypothetical protein [Nanoarchaeota archaeon]HIH51046.1 hypothetical protein [Nanoarchaeota archaeon]HIH66202.1 hypothetical protein [Nanoarchaeota archaeon]
MTNQTEKVFRAFADEDYKSALERTVKAGYTPFTVAQVARAFIDGDLPDDKSYATTTGIAYAGDGVHIKIADIDFKNISNLSCGTAPLTLDQYDELPGISLNMRGVRTNEKMSKILVLNDTLWNELIGDHTLPFVDHVFDGNKYGSRGAMPVYISKNTNQLGIRPVVLSGTNDRFSANVLQGDYPVRVAGIGEEGNYGREDAILDLALDRMGPGDFKTFKKGLEKINF